MKLHDDQSLRRTIFDIAIDANVRSAPKRPSYWVRSKQTNEISGFGRRPVPARFKKLEDAKLYCRELNLRRGAYHPGYFVQEQDDGAVSGSGLQSGS
jgi:hypothetical protein